MKNQYIKINEDGNTCYYSDKGMTIRHREDGPAIEFVSGDKEWHFDGERLTEKEFNKRPQPEMAIVIEGKR